MQKALEVVQALAEGVNPVTGEVLPDQSPYNQPDVIRALYACVSFIQHPPGKVKRRWNNARPKI